MGDTEVVAETRCLHTRSYGIYNIKEELQQVVIK